MKNQKSLITYITAGAVAILIALINIYFEISTYGKEKILLYHFISDGFFTSAVLYIGSGALVLISEAGNFYGLQYLGYTMLNLFSLHKERFHNRKDYFTYCMEKKLKQKEQGKNAVKWALFVVGIACLLISVIFAFLYYQLL